MTWPDTYIFMQSTGLLVAALWAGRTESRLNGVDILNDTREDLMVGRLSRLEDKIDTVLLEQTRISGALLVAEAIATRRRRASSSSRDSKGPHAS